MHIVFKRALLASLAMLFILPVFAISIIPCPLEMKETNGRFVLAGLTLHHFNAKCEKEIAYLEQKLASQFSVTLKGVRNQRKADIKFNVDEGQNLILGNEGYRLIINKKGIYISAAAPAGIFYGIQTVFQLIEKDSGRYFLPYVEIFDKPRFVWRAFLLDEARSFKGSVAVKQLLDEMALLKMNVFHWHLTDDQGWRMQILKYPRLTAVSSGPVTVIKCKTFYTQQEIKEIVDYASARHIMIIPEIEMPGHASAAIAAYPDLGVEKKTITMPQGQGIYTNIFDVSDPSVLTFIHDVLDEVMALFPSKIIHIGGDEVKYETWRNSSHVDAFMKENNIQSPAALQLWFVNGISQYLHAKGYRTMGWNDMLGKHDVPSIGENLSRDAIVHFWLGSPALINRATAAGFDVVNSFHEYTYLDYSYKSISLEKAYSFEPVPPLSSEQFKNKIIGLGCQMWGEHIPTIEKMHYQVFPRIAAYAETGWATNANKNFGRFKKALLKLASHWKENDIAVDISVIQ